VSKTRIIETESSLKITRKHNADLEVLTSEDDKALIQFYWDNRTSKSELDDNSLDVLIRRLIKIQGLRNK